MERCTVNKKKRSPDSLVIARAYRPPESLLPDAVYELPKLT